MRWWASPCSSSCSAGGHPAGRRARSAMSKFTTQHEDFRNLQRRLLYLRTGLLLCLLLLSARLWYLQVVQGTYYHELAEQNRVRTVDLKPARGLIFDRHGELLANNVPSFNLYLTVEDIRDREGLAAELEDLIGLPRAETMKRLIQQAKSYVPILLKSGLTLREAALLEGHRRSEERRVGKGWRAGSRGDRS